MIATDSDKEAERKAHKRAVDKAYRDANKERLKAYRKDYVLANKERIAGHKRAYTQANRETINERCKRSRQEHPETLKAYYQANKEKLNARHAAYYAANKEALNAKNKAYRETNRARINLVNQAAKYGLRPEDVIARAKAQGNRCFICKRSFADTKIHVDHCHSSGVVRGLLCGDCNRGVGNFREDPKRLRNAIRYLVVCKASTRISEASEANDGIHDRARANH